jgi:hypothetical protein
LKGTLKIADSQKPSPSIADNNQKEHTARQQQQNEEKEREIHASGHKMTTADSRSC